MSGRRGEGHKDDYHYRVNTPEEEKGKEKKPRLVLLRFRSQNLVLSSERSAAEQPGRTNVNAKTRNYQSAAQFTHAGGGEKRAQTRSGASFTQLVARSDVEKTASVEIKHLPFFSFDTLLMSNAVF